ncbi:unnamed protein product [Ilex paraguariensis]|uniref:Uncharacterized protein n=1 Tax=Ilex paraguariensis TaxID=185542 RepID=A0ABC8SHG3_9AQUA
MLRDAVDSHCPLTTNYDDLGESSVKEGITRDFDEQRGDLSLHWLEEILVGPSTIGQWLIPHLIDERELVD